MRDLVTMTDVDRLTDPDDPTPRALVGLDEADRPVWWTPTTHGNARFVCATGAGRTTMLRSLVVQMLRYTAIPAGDRLVGTASGPARRVSTPPQAPAPVTVLDGTHGGEWRTLAEESVVASAARVTVAEATAPAAVRAAVADLALFVGRRDVDRRRVTGPDRRKGPRFLILDGAGPVRDALDEAGLVDLSRIMVDGPAVGVYTVEGWHSTITGDVPPWTGFLALAGLAPSTARRLVGEAVPSMSGHPRGRWVLHGDTGWTTVQGVNTPAPGH